ncbi:MAG TPA: hypothetical protein VLS86_07710 [Acidimicrobiia bacterium]|nr:hypothetical protein [Acidimicrobiia bacterium]
MSRLDRLAAAGVGIAIPAAMVLGAMLGGVAALAVLLVAVAVGWRYVPGFLRTIAQGFLAGVIAGVLILGPGFRLAMRVVAIFDIRRVEFTLEGTLFIILFIGGVVGGAVGIAAVFLRRGLGWSPGLMTGVMAVAIMSLLLIDTGLRSELVELGAGPWLNIPMFTAVTIGYGLATNRLIDRFAARRSRRETREPVKVPK